MAWSWVFWVENIVVLCLMIQCIFERFLSSSLENFWTAMHYLLLNEICACPLEQTWVEDMSGVPLNMFAYIYAFHNLCKTPYFKRFWIEIEVCRWCRCYHVLIARSSQLLISQFQQLLFSKKVDWSTIKYPVLTAWFRLHSYPS